MTANRKRILIGLAILLIGLTVSVAAFLKPPIAEHQSDIDFQSDIDVTERPNDDDDHRPNIILVYLDDVDCETVFHDWNQPGEVAFPNIRELANAGTTLTNFHVTTPVCGPSRACMLSGRYAHAIGFRVNDDTVESSNGFSGGFGTFDGQQELGVWMTHAGYNTVYVGKYLHHGYAPDFSSNETWLDMKPVGWKIFNATFGSKYFEFVWYDGESNPRYIDSDVYRTDFEAHRVVDIVEEQTESNERRTPLMICWAPLASHASSDSMGIVDPKNRQWQLDSVPRSIDATLVSDDRSLPSQMKRLPVISDAERIRFQKMWVQRRQSLRSVDEGLALIRNSLKKLGELENTIFIFTSDHGFELGHHRHVGKRLCYDRVTKVPCIVSGPGVKAGVTNNELLANIDLAPTILELAGGEIPDGLDGKSFVSVLNPSKDDRPPIHPGGIVIENWDDALTRGKRIDAVYSALRTQDHVYTEWAVGDHQYFDLLTDPDQTNNLFDSLSDEEQQSLWRQLRKIERAPIDPTFARQIRLTRPNESSVLSDEECPVVSLASGRARLTGFVEDDQGIADVQLVIRDRQSNAFWNGLQWTSSFSSVPCLLDLPNGQLTRWSFEFPSQMFAGLDDSQQRTVELSLVASDLQRNTSTWQRSATIKLTDAIPETHPQSSVAGAEVNAY